MTKPTLTRLRNLADDHAGERSSNQLRALWLFLGAQDIYRRHFPETGIIEERRPPSPAEPEKLLAFALENFFRAHLPSENDFRDLAKAQLPGKYVMYRPDMTLAQMESLKRSGRRVPRRVRVSLVDISKDGAGMFIQETENFPHIAQDVEYHEVHSGPLVTCRSFLLAIMKKNNAQSFKSMVIENMRDERGGVVASFWGKLLEPGVLACLPSVRFFCSRVTASVETGYRSYSAIPKEIAKHLKTPTFDPKRYPIIA